MIERTGVQPDAARAQRPGVAHRAGQEMFSKPAAELGSNDAEVGNLHRIVLRDAPQLVPAGERGLCARLAGRNEELDGGVGEVLRDLLVRPVPPVEPVKGLTDRAIAHPVQLGLWARAAGNCGTPETPEHPLELFLFLESRN